MNLNQLHYFATLAHLEHYTKAAEELCITQPSLSHAIHSLERELGTCLFQKQGRNVILTKYGSLFLEYVEDSLNVLNTGIKKLKSVTGTTSGQIDLAYIYTLGSEFAPRLVREFLSDNSQMDVHFQFAVGNTSDLIAGLKEERYDVVFCSRSEKEENIIFTPVYREELVVVVPKHHPLARKGAILLEETIRYPQIFFTAASGLRPMVDNLFRIIGQQPDIAYEIEEDASMAGLVAENFGIAVMPRIPILKNLNVEVLTILEPTFERYVCMARMKNKYITPAVSEFIHFMERSRG